MPMAYKEHATRARAYLPHTCPTVNIEEELLRIKLST